MPKKTKNPSLTDVLAALERDVFKKPAKKATAKKRTPIWKRADAVVHKPPKRAKGQAKKLTPPANAVAHSASGVPTVRTQLEINAEIDRLRELTSLVPKYTFFGDDNVERLNAQIDTLCNLYDDEEVTETYLYGDTNDDHGEPTEAAYDIEAQAMEASNWLYEAGAPKPSLGWEPLAKSKEKAK